MRSPTNQRSIRYRTGNPGTDDVERQCIMTAAKYELNNKGANVHPCLRQFLTSNASNILPLMRTLADMPLWRDLMTSNMRGGTPNFSRNIHCADLGTESYAFPRSTSSAHPQLSLIFPVQKSDFSTSFQQSSDCNPVVELE